MPGVRLDAQEVHPWARLFFLICLYHDSLINYYKMKKVKNDIFKRKKVKEEDFLKVLDIISKKLITIFYLLLLI